MPRLASASRRALPWPRCGPGGGPRGRSAPASAPPPRPGARLGRAGRPVPVGVPASASTGAAPAAPPRVPRARIRSKSMRWSHLRPTHQQQTARRSRPTSQQIAPARSQQSLSPRRGRASSGAEWFAPRTRASRSTRQHGSRARGGTGSTAGGRPGRTRRSGLLAVPRGLRAHRRPRRVQRLSGGRRAAHVRPAGPRARKRFHPAWGWGGGWGGRRGQRGREPSPTHRPSSGYHSPDASPVILPPKALQPQQRLRGKRRERLNRRLRTWEQQRKLSVRLGVRPSSPRPPSGLQTQA